MEPAATVPGVDPNAPPAADPNAPPAVPPQTVPLGVHVGERRQWQGKVSSLNERLQQLETENASLKGKQAPANPTEEEAWKDQALTRLGIKDKLAKIDALEEENKKLQARAENGDRAHAMIVSQQNRAMDKASKITDESFTPELKAIGFTKESWDQLVAAEITDDEIGELFANPSYMKEIIKRCVTRYQPHINSRKANQAATVLNLPRTPGPGGNPPAPPANEPLKVGKALHGRAFERLQGFVKAE